MTWFRRGFERRSDAATRSSNAVRTFRSRSATVRTDATSSSTSHRLTGLPAYGSPSRKCPCHRAVNSPPRRPLQGHRPGAVRGRPLAAGDAARRHGPQPGPARTASAASTSIPAFPGTSSSSSRPPTFPAPTASRSSSTTSPAWRADRVNHPEEPVVLLAHPRSAHASKRRGVTSRIDVDPAAGRLHDRRGARRAARSSGAPTTSSRAIWSRAATSTRRSPTADDRRRRRVRDRRAGAALHRAERHDRRSPSPDDGVTVWGSMQCPYYIHKALAGAVRPAGRARSASCRWKPAAGSAARKSTRRSSPATRRCWRGSPAGR